MTSAFGYLRTSSATNVGPDKDSDKRQMAAITAYADHHGIEILGWFYDANVKGSDPIQSRPGFAAMLEKISAGDSRMILVETPNRFARELMIQEGGFEFLRKLNIALVPVDAPDYFTANDDPMRKAIRQILGVIAELDKSLTVAKLRSARDRKSLRLGRRCEGARPAPEPVIAMARSIRSTGASLRDVSKALAQAGHLSPSGRPYLAGSIASMVRL